MHFIFPVNTVSVCLDRYVVPVGTLVVGGCSFRVLYVEGHSVMVKLSSLNSCSKSPNLELSTVNLFCGDPNVGHV